MVERQRVSGAIKMRLGASIAPSFMGSNKSLTAVSSLVIWIVLIEQLNRVVAKCNALKFDILPLC